MVIVIFKSCIRLVVIGIKYDFLFKLLVFLLFLKSYITIVESKNDFKLL